MPRSSHSMCTRRRIRMRTDESSLQQAESGERVLGFQLVNGPATFVAPPNLRLSLRVELDGMDTEALDVVSPGPGEELKRAVSLAPALQAQVRLEARGRADFPIEQVLLSFYAFDDREKPRYYRSPRFERLF